MERPNLPVRLLAHLSRQDELVVVAVVTALASFLVAAVLINPVEVAHDDVLVPIGKSVGIGEGKCPDGWEYRGPTALSPSAIEPPKCINDPYIVFLLPNTTDCNYIFDTSGRGEIPCNATTDGKRVWPK